MDESEIQLAVSTILLSLSRVEIERCDQIGILELALDELRRREEIDEAAFSQIAE